MFCRRLDLRLNATSDVLRKASDRQGSAFTLCRASIDGNGGSPHPLWRRAAPVGFWVGRRSIDGTRIGESRPRGALILALTIFWPIISERQEIRGTTNPSLSCLGLPF